MDGWRVDDGEGETSSPDEEKAKEALLPFTPYPDPSSGLGYLGRGGHPSTMSPKGCSSLLSPPPVSCPRPPSPPRHPHPLPIKVRVW